MKQYRLRQWLLFLLGVLFTAMGISLITTPGLGSSPVTSLSYALTFILPGSLGLFAFLVNLALFFGQVLILRREFPPAQLLQIPAIVVFSIFLDFWMLVFSGLDLQLYAVRLLVAALGCCVLGLGIAFQVLADVLILPAEGFVKVVAAKLGREFGLIKTIYDIAMVTAAVTISMLCLGRIEGVGVATVLAALITGYVSRFFRVRVAALLKRLGHSEQADAS